MFKKEAAKRQPFSQSAGLYHPATVQSDCKTALPIVQRKKPEITLAFLKIIFSLSFCVPFNSFLVVDTKIHCVFFNLKIKTAY